MNNRQKAARASQRGNLLFFGCLLLALLCGAFAATSDNKTALIVGLCLAAAFLIVGCVLVYLHSRIVSRYVAAAKEEEERLAAEQRAEDECNLEKFAEDGLPGAFCYEIRGYSAPQLRLILDEQEDEYTPEEFAYIKKVLAEKE